MRNSRLLGTGTGSLLALLLWALVVPWDLSERVDATGNQSGGDDYAGRIALVLLLIALAGVALAIGQATNRIAVPITAGACALWVALFAWRAGVSEVSGANMFMIPLVVAVIPAGILVPAFVALIAGGVRDRAR